VYVLALQHCSPCMDHFTDLERCMGVISHIIIWKAVYGEV